jgi:hypothetical protein
MSEEQTNFKVTDRRLFNADGSPRDVPPEERPRDEAKEKPVVAETSAAADIPSQPAPTVASSPEATAETRQPNQAEGDEELPGADDPASFASFLMSIASNAASSLGMMEHPVTRKREVDLELGKHWIDVLGMLQEKTRGNLLAQEQQILEGLLADLRMQYVSLANSTPAKASRTYTARDITGG